MDYDVHNMLVAKYGMSRDQAIAINENLSGKAKEIGLTLQFATLILTNTFDAHRLAKYAFNQGKMNPNAQELFRAYFTYFWNLGDHETLVELVVKVALDRDEALKVLAGGSARRGRSKPAWRQRSAVLRHRPQIRRIGGAVNRRISQRFADGLEGIAVVESVGRCRERI
ncbi:DsbA family protein [Paenibacillus sp. MER TA 81-3]|nr:DsbA family protein [Paenibacillus sp. MER TA 81-3]